MSDIIVREARVEDVSEIHALILELAQFENGLNRVTITPKDLEYDGFGSDPLFRCLIAEHEGVIKGIAVYFFTYSTWNGKCLYLEDLIVTEKYRASGIGSALMERLIALGRDEGVKRMSWQVLDWNVQAQEFYKKFGSIMDDEWFNGRLDSDQIQSFKK